MALTLEQVMALYGDDPMKQRLITSFLGGSESVVLPLLYWVDANELLGYTYSDVTDLGDVSERSINGAYTDSDAKGAPKRIPTGLFGGSAKTDQIYIDAQGDEARMLRIDKRMIAAGKYFDDTFINGDSQANPKQFNGLRKLCEMRAGTPNTFWCGANGGALTMDLLDEALDQVAGDNTKKIIFCDRPTRREITKAVRGTATGSNTLEVQTQLQSYNGAKILTITENHKFAPVFKTNEVRGNTATNRSLYVVRFGGATDQEYVQGVRGKTFMKLRTPVNMGEYVRDVIDNILGIGEFGNFSIARIGGIQLT